MLPWPPRVAPVSTVAALVIEPSTSSVPATTSVGPSIGVGAREIERPRADLRQVARPRNGARERDIVAARVDDRVARLGEDDGIAEVQPVGRKAEGRAGIEAQRPRAQRRGAPRHQRPRPSREVPPV